MIANLLQITLWLQFLGTITLCQVEAIRAVIQKDAQQLLQDEPPDAMSTIQLKYNDQQIYKKYKLEEPSVSEIVQSLFKNQIDTQQYNKTQSKKFQEKPKHHFHKIVNGTQSAAQKHRRHHHKRESAFDHLKASFKSFFQMSPVETIKEDNSTFDQITDEKQKAYQKQFSAIADSDLDTNKIDSWTSQRERYMVVDDAATVVHNYCLEFRKKLKQKFSDAFGLFRTSDNEQPQQKDSIQHHKKSKIKEDLEKFGDILYDVYGGLKHVGYQSGKLLYKAFGALYTFLQMSFSNGLEAMKSSNTSSQYDMDKNDILYIVMFGILISLFLCLCCVLICVGRWAIAIVVVVIAIVLIVVAAIVYENNRPEKGG